MQGIDKYRRLYKAIGYTFTNEALLEQALLGLCLVLQTLQLQNKWHKF